MSDLWHSWGTSPKQKAREKEYNHWYYEKFKEKILRNRKIRDGLINESHDDAQVYSYGWDTNGRVVYDDYNSPTHGIRARAMLLDKNREVDSSGEIRARGAAYNEEPDGKSSIEYFTSYAPKILRSRDWKMRIGPVRLSSSEELVTAQLDLSGAKKIMSMAEGAISVGKNIINKLKGGR